LALQKEFAEAREGHAQEIEDLRRRYEEHVTEIASASKTVEAAILEARRRAKVEVSEVRDGLTAENRSMQEALGGRLAEAKVVIDRLATEKAQLVALHHACAAQLRSAKHALLLLARGAGPLLLRSRELVVQKAILAKQLRHSEQALEEVVRVASTVNLGMASSSDGSAPNSLGALVDEVLRLPSENAARGEGLEVLEVLEVEEQGEGGEEDDIYFVEKGMEQQQETTRRPASPKPKPKPKRHVPALRTVAIVVAAAVRFRRMATGGGSSWFGVVDGIGAAAGSTSNNTNSNNRDHRGRGRATDSDGRDGSRSGKIPTSLLRTSDLPDPDPVLPPLELLASGPEGELFEVLVEKLTGQRARWSEDFVLRDAFSFFESRHNGNTINHHHHNNNNNNNHNHDHDDFHGDSGGGKGGGGLPLLEALAEGTIPHAVRLAARGVCPPRGVGTSEALQVSRSLDDGSCNRVTLARWRRAAERGTTGHALAAGLEAGLVALARRVAQGDEDNEESWAALQELENARSSDQAGIRRRDEELRKHAHVISVLNTAKEEVSNELQEERRKHKATAKALQKLRTAPPPAEQVSLHHEESKHRDELRTALALDRAATHFGTSPPSSSSSSSSSSSFVDQ
jgi:hypothetical protein